mmetsp:Transcript_31623/g.92966  ORF Transcript_31623/g.92966 Transcript_31623/m.92966 type:complete len:258 (-) Transcript_31623:51-824(-)
MVTKSPVSSVQSSPSLVDRHTAVPYSPRPIAPRSAPCKTSVRPDHDRLPSSVAPCLKRCAQPPSSCHDWPPSVVRRGTAPTRVKNMTLVLTTSSWWRRPVSPAAWLHGDQLRPWSLLTERQSALKAYSPLPVGSTSRPVGCSDGCSGAQLHEPPMGAPRKRLERRPLPCPTLCGGGGVCQNRCSSSGAPPSQRGAAEAVLGCTAAARPPPPRPRPPLPARRPTLESSRGREKTRRRRRRRRPPRSDCGRARPGRRER